MQYFPKPIPLYFLSLWKNWNFQNARRIKRIGSQTVRVTWPIAGCLEAWDKTNIPVYPQDYCITLLNISIWRAFCVNFPCVQHSYWHHFLLCLWVQSLQSLILVEPFETTKLCINPSTYLRLRKIKRLWRVSHPTFSFNIFLSKEQTLSLSTAFVYIWMNNAFKEQ